MDLIPEQEKMSVLPQIGDEWWSIPEPVLLRVLWMLPIRDILSTGGTCWRWRNISNDEVMWKHKFQQHYKVHPSIELKPGAESWKSEYKRLTSNIPLIQSQRLEGHAHQVLHVSFSHNGEMFATCSKDGYVIVWNSAHPCTEKYSHNMKQFSWKYTQYSQFNQSDTLLLVSGVHFGSPHSTSGEIAVFTVDGKLESHLRCRVVNRPYDIFGTWFSDQYLISGDLHWLAHLVSTSVLWLNKANQEIDSEHVPIMNQLYKFYNKNASSVRAIMMAKCPWLDALNDPLAEDSIDKDNHPTGLDMNSDEIKSPSTSSSAGNPLSHAATLRGTLRSVSPDDYLLDISESSPSMAGSSFSRSAHGGVDSTIRYLEEYRRRERLVDTENTDSSSEEDEPMDGADEYDDMENSIPKYLIFSTGSKTYTPHQIGIKRIRDVNFPKKLDPGPSLKERIAAKKAAEQQTEPRADPDWWNYESVADRFDKVDKIIDLHGHIIGMALSPDHRYLYVNTRPWPQNYVITNALEPPPIAQEIDIHVIDLMTLKRVGNMLRAHKAYTPSTECFFIFLDVCDDYVASGAEDMHAYLWDRYYGTSLAKYKHSDVVNSVAFNPRDSEMLVTTSDDYTIKVWNSAHPCTEKYSHNMKQFSWKYTQYSQFNQSDTLLLVSGVHFGSPHSTSGEIAVFTVDGKLESHLRCRVVNRPYDIFGTWFSDQYLISGDLHWLAHLVSTSVLWLNKANQEIDSEHVPIMNQLYKFYNKNASSVRAIMMAKCPWLDALNDPLAEDSIDKDNHPTGLDMNSDEIKSPSTSSSAGNPLSHAATLRGTLRSVSPDDYLLDISESSPSMAGSSFSRSAHGGVDSTIRYLEEYRRRERLVDTENTDSSSEEDEPMDGADEYDDMENSIPKYLIFSTGSKTYTPHQIGIKRIRDVNFPKKLDPGPSLKERIAAKKAAEQQTEPRADPDWWNYESVADRFDKVDKIIDLHGHIIGMALSPDHRYLYVNTRPWPQNYVITNALEPPPIAQEIDIHVIDLMTLKRVGNMLRAHKAYTPSTECFFIFLDVCDDYVASGAEDMHAYLWDRYYGTSLAKYKHSDVVNSVAFNPRDSEMLVTTSDDYTIKVWNSAHPCTEKYSHNMKQFSWKYTQYSQFNQSDTLLLVSGVHFGSPHSTSGEIAVFTVDGKLESHLRCRVVNRPYDIFGTWFSDQYLISGDLHWLAHLVSTSVLWLNKANQEIDSEHVPIMNQLYKFYNKNASSVRAIMMAKCPWLDALNDPLAEDSIDKDNHPTGLDMNSDEIKSPSTSSSAGNPLSHAATLRGTLRSVSPDDYLLDISESSPSMAGSSFSRSAHGGVDSTIRYLEEYRRRERLVDTENTDSSSEEDEPMDGADEYDDMENSIPKYLIFSTGSKTYTPHQIGIKRIRDVNFPKKLDPGPSLKERIAAKKAAEQQTEPRADPDWWNYESVADRFDKVDKIIDLHGHIIGMALSPDHRYLYVNTRPWPQNYVITNALEPPPIAQEIDIHVIDLMTLKRVGNMLRAHKAYTPSTECFFIFLDVCDDYVASGAEDMHAYLWDRYYGTSLAKYKHSDVVNSVAFNPRDSEMLVTTSDDYTIKVWNSAHPCTEKYSHNMKQFSWKYTQYSQFNQSDTLLLVSGVHFGSPHSTSGEIAVFTVDGKLESHLRCRVVNRPYDIFGTWFSDQYLISGDLHWLAHLVSTSVLWLNKANQEIDSEHVPIMNQLYKFYNKNASSVRAIMMAKCPWLDALNDPLAEDSIDKDNHPTGLDMNSDEIKSPSTSSSAGNPLSHAATLRGTLRSVSPDDYLLDISESSPSMAGSSFSRSAHGGVDSTIRYLEEYRRRERLVDTENTDSSSEEDEPMDGADEYDDMENSIPKYLIFSTGSKTYTPHQIGIKRIRDVNFPKKLDPGPSLKERIAAKKAAEQQTEPRADPDWWNYESVADRFDKVDKIIDLHGHIIGMALSPDHRYLYVNTRPWPQNYVITNALEPPPIAQEIDIHVIDLMTLKRVGNMLRAHKAYTPSTECFFIFLDVCDDYVASGAEDMHAYLWDRYYGTSLAKYKHSDVVNSVAFNPRDSEMLVTTSDDYTIKVWNSAHPCTEKYSHNMKQFSWKYTQYSQFNQSDTLLLVSGVHFGSPHSTSGEIAVFTVDGKLESHLRCRVVNRPYDIFGTWFSDQYLISGDLHWLAHLVSTSVLWLNKANQEIDSEHVPIMNQLYKFYNKNASSVRAIMMAKCPWLDALNDPLAEDSIDKDNHPTGLDMNSDEIKSPSTSSSAGNPLSHAATLRGTLRSVSPDDYLLDISESSPSMAGSSFSRSAHGGVDSTIRYLEEYRRRERLVDTENTDSSSEEDEPMDGADEYDDMENSIPKYLIFSTGSKTYTPHQIGIKRIRDVNFPKKLDPGPSLKERIAAKKAAEQQTEPRADPDWWNYESVADRFDKVDKIIDLHGHIIGMALSPDHRYLYVNTRPWPQNYVITNALEPPPIAQEIDIHVIDLMTLKRVGNMLRAHKAYTPSTECFFIFLDVCDDYVASGAEDMHAYLWDRYYGTSLAKYKHSDVVNSVAFNPRDSEMLVTTSDDYTIKVWNSAHPCTEKYSHNMKQFSWKYTQYSQFNQSDTLLLVSGVHFGSPHSTSGEIAVFTVDGKLESHLRCRVVNRPYDIFGTWFSDQYLISGDLHWLAHLVSTSVLWLNKANQEIDSEHVPIMNQLYKFYNKNASSVRAIMMAKCPWLDALNDPLAEDSIDKDNHPTGLDMNSDKIKSPSTSSSAGNPLSHAATLRGTLRSVSPDDYLLDISESSPSMAGSSFSRSAHGGVDSTIRYLEEYRRRERLVDTENTDSSSEEDEPMDGADEYDDMENSIPKYLIFSTGSKTYTPHQIGIKRIRDVNFPKKLDPGPSLKERIAAKKAAEQQTEPRADPDWWNYESVADRFDKVDKIIDLHGHIIGMALSPDHRYLYVNTRPWPQNYVITNALEPPPIAQEIDIHVIDLMTLKRVGNMLRAHKAYTPSTECFFIFLDVCDDYVASGAEDMHAYLWDRYYGTSLAKYKHSDVVNSVAFNPRDSEMLVTTSDDYTIKVWNSAHPCTEKYSHNMKQFSWKYTQYSQFNQSDTLLLVSGVHFGSPHSTSGEIAVFTVDGKLESHLRCRVVNRPYDIFGTWFSDQYLISGDLHWLAHLVSTSVLWLNKANQEIDSEHVPIMNQLYKFYNKNASSVRAIMMAKCPWLDALNDPLAEDSIDKDNHPTGLDMNSDEIKSPSTSSSAGNPLSHAATLRGTLRSVSPDDYLLDISESSPSMAGSSFSRSAHGGVDSTIRYLEEYRRRERLVDTENTDSSSEEDEPMDGADEYDDMENSIPKYLIFSTGSKTYTPHQIGIKRIRDVNFPKKLDPGPSLKERIAAKKAAEQQTEPRADPDWWNYESVADRFDKVDKIIDLHGHIIGMALSPDHRYLYVNTRPWPQNYVITNALEPPPIAQEIDIHVIDLMTLKRVGNMLRAHKAYTPSTECFFIFLDVCDDYVASGAEDMHAYLWDRYYGTSLAKYKHSDVVNSVAFNPRDSEMLVTTSDDYTIKIWRSRTKAKEYNLNTTDNCEGFELKKIS